MVNEKSIAIKGGAWITLSTIVNLFTSVLRIAILTRFLDKSDFGTVSIVNLVILLCNTFTDLGFSSVILYRQKLTKVEFSSLFWIQFIVYGLIYVILYIASSPLSNFYKIESLNILIPIASITIILQAFGKLYDTVLQKQYQFKTISIRNIISNLLSLIVAPIFAMKGFGVYSLIYSALIQSAVLNLWNFYSGIRYQNLCFKINLKEISSLLKIGVYQTGTRIFDFISGKLDVLIIGKALGVEALGVYDLAKELVYKLVYLIQAIISKVAQPLLTNSNHDDEIIKLRFLKMTKVVAYLCIPICFSVAIFSKYIIIILYGEKYIEAAPLVSIFSLITLVSSITSFFDMLGVAKGRTDLNFKYTIYRIIITIPVVLLACQRSIIFVSISQLFLLLILVPIYWNIVVAQTYRIDVNTYISQFKKVFLVFLTIALITVSFSLNSFWGLIINQILEMTACLGLYLVLVFVGIKFFLYNEFKTLISI